MRLHYEPARRLQIGLSTSHLATALLSMLPDHQLHRRLWKIWCTETKHQCANMMKVCIKKDSLWSSQPVTSWEHSHPQADSILCSCFRRRIGHFGLPCIFPSTHSGPSGASLSWNYAMPSLWCLVFRSFSLIGQWTTECPLMPEQWAHNLGLSERCQCN
jgi:hypothetical protein